MKTIVEFIEPECPYCRYVYHYVLRDILVRRMDLNQKMTQQGMKKYIPPFDIKVVDIVANKGCKEEQWFTWYSRKIGGRYTPVIVVEDVGFYLWGKEKPKELKQEELSRTERLKVEIIRELVKDYFEKKPQYFDKELMIQDRGIVT